MYLTFRWFGENDPVPLSYIRQIPAMRGVVSALYDIDAMTPWPAVRLSGMRNAIESAGLEFRIVESIPVSDEIKLGGARRDEAVEIWLQSLRAVADTLGPVSKKGLSEALVVTYNFMPVFDWTRSTISKQFPDGSTALAYDDAAIKRMDPLTGELELPGWLTRYSRAELAELLERSRGLSSDALYANLVGFLRDVTPEAERLGVKLAIHPDDPPWPVFGIPRVMTGSESARRLFRDVPSAANGLCFCTGSFGADPANDIAAMAKEFAPRIHFAHLRNVSIDGPRSFSETAHYSRAGHLDMAAIVKALSAYNVPVRPDHGRMIWSEAGRAGYGLYDRALGAAYLLGLMEASDNADTRTP